MNQHWSSWVGILLILIGLILWARSIWKRSRQ